MEIKIDVKDYLSDEDIQQIARTEAVALVRSKLREEKDVERIITNGAYQIVWEKVGELFDTKLETMLTEKVSQIVEGLSEFSVFKKPDAWDRGTNKPYDVLQEAVLKNKSVIEEKVKDIIDTAPTKVFNEALQLGIKQIIVDKLRK